MNKDFRDLLVLYISIVTSSSIVTSLKLLSIFLKASRNCNKLKYDRKSMEFYNKMYLFDPGITCFFDILSYIICSLRLNVTGVYTIYDNEEEFYNYYLSEINENIKEVNEYEDSKRESIMDLVKRLEDECEYYFDNDDLKALNLNMSIKNFKKFLKKYDLYYELDSEGYPQINVLKKKENM